MKLLIFLSLILLAASGGTLDAAVTIAEHLKPSTGSFSITQVGAGMGTDDDIVYDNRVAQTFLATSTGFLEGISFNVYRFDAMGLDADLRVSVTGVLGGQPGDLLESVLLPFASIGMERTDSLPPGSFTKTVSTSGATLLVAGEIYALVFSTDTTEANYRLRGDTSGYPEGNLLRYQNFGLFHGDTNADLEFRITGMPIPEPQIISIFSMLVGLLALRRR